MSSWRLPSPVFRSIQAIRPEVCATAHRRQQPARPNGQVGELDTNQMTREEMDDKFDQPRFEAARRRVCDDMAADEGLRIAYQANIAMAIFDHSDLAREACNRVTDKIMTVLFEV